MYLEIRYFYFIWKSDKTVCSHRGQFPLRGKGKGPLAQRPLPLRPPPEIRRWRRLARFPPYPLVAQRGGTAVPPLWKPLPETRDGAGKTSPQGDEGRETRIKQKTDRVVRSEAERTGAEIRRFGFPPRCAPHSQMRGYADLIFGYSAAGRQLPDFVGSA